MTKKLFFSFSVIGLLNEMVYVFDCKRKNQEKKDFFILTLKNVLATFDYSSIFGENFLEGDKT